MDALEAVTRKSPLKPTLIGRLRSCALPRDGDGDERELGRGRTFSNEDQGNISERNDDDTEFLNRFLSYGVKE